jgi:hypothetical protein
MPRATSSQEDKDFGELLKESVDFSGMDASWVLEWVADNFAPEEVFEDSVLEAWAEDNGYDIIGE